MACESYFNKTVGFFFFLSKKKKKKNYFLPRPHDGTPKTYFSNPPWLSSII